MSAHDRYLAGYRSTPVGVTCKQCGNEWDDTYTEEYGAGWLEHHEECPECGASGDDLDLGEPDGPDPDEAYDRMRDDEAML